MVAIVNISNSFSQTKPQKYSLRINRNEVCTFTHIPIEGLAACLEQAALAVRSKNLDNFDPKIIAELLGKQ